MIALPGLAVIKLIAWNESVERAKDIEDFYYLLHNYADIATDDLYLQENLDILEEYDEVRFAGARLLGKEIANIINSSGELKKLVFDIVNKLVEGFDQADINEMYEADKFDQYILRLKLVKELLVELD